MNIKKIILIMVLLVFLLNSCTDKNLESKTSSETQEISNVFEVKSELKVGDAPHDFTVVTTEGKAVRLNDFIKQKRPVIIYFMATWCPYCAQDYAALSKVYKNYENKVSILSISLDLNEDLNVLREYKKKYPELQKVMFAGGQTEILVNYRITKTTTKYVVGKDGKIIYIGSGAFNEQLWKTLLEELSKS